MAGPCSCLANPQALVLFADEIGLSRYKGEPLTITEISMIPLLFLYIPGRLVLLVLPFLGLRLPPPAAYHVVHWTSLIPHIWLALITHHCVCNNTTPYYLREITVRKDRKNLK